MWVPSLLRPPQTISKFGQKRQFWPQNMLPWVHIGLAGSFGALLVGGYGARAVCRKTPIYFIILIIVFKGWSTWFREMACHSSLLTGAVHLLDLIYLTLYTPAGGT